MKKTINIRHFVNHEIQVGDTVMLRDGSALTCDTADNPEVYIVCAYPNLTGEDTILKDIECEVVEIGITNKVCYWEHDSAYGQDILIKVGKGFFRTASQLVCKL